MGSNGSLLYRKLSFALGASVSLVCVCLGCAGSPIHSTKAHGLEPLRTVFVFVFGLARTFIGALRTVSVLITWHILLLERRGAVVRDLVVARSVGVKDLVRAVF